jgi:hypothetical protein
MTVTPTIELRDRTSSSLLTTSSVLCVIGALAYASVVVLEPDATDRAAFASPTGIAGCILATLGLALALVHLTDRAPSPTGWPRHFTIIAIAFTLAAAWLSGTATVAIGDHTNDAQFEAIGSSGWTMMFLAPKMLLAPIGFIGWAVTARRSGHLRRSSAIALGLAGVASLLPPFAPGVLILGISFGLIARQSVPATSRTEQARLTNTPAG